jgi:hypothetical protein
MTMAEEQILARLAKVEEKLERLSRLQKFADVFDSFHDLGRDVSLLTYPAVKMLTEELGEVETGFQREDLSLVLKRFLLSLRHIAWGLDQLENLVDWWKDMEPIMKLAVPHIIDILEDLDQKGIFRGYKAMLEGYAKIAQTLQPRGHPRHCPGSGEHARRGQKILGPEVRHLCGTVDGHPCPGGPGWGQTPGAPWPHVAPAQPGVPPGAGGPGGAYRGPGQAQPGQHPDRGRNGVSEKLVCGRGPGVAGPRVPGPPPRTKA